MSTEVNVSVIPDCDFCKEQGETKPAYCDGKTSFGPWANMCVKHHNLHGTGLGLGRGQRFLLNGKVPTDERVLFESLECHEEPVSREHGTAIARINRLIQKARHANDLIPLSEKEWGDWEKRIHQAIANANFIAIRTRPRYKRGQGHAAKKNVTFSEKNSVES